LSGVASAIAKSGNRPVELRREERRSYRPWPKTSCKSHMSSASCVQTAQRPRMNRRCLRNVPPSS